MTKKIKLLTRTIDALERPAKGRAVYQDEDDRYLHLVVSPSASSWRYIRKINGRVVFITIGQYPDVTPQQARQESRKYSAEYTMGQDPREKKREARQCKTWGELFDWYVEQHAKPHKRTWAGDVWQEKRYCGEWKNRLVTAITRSVIKSWHTTISKKHGRFAADRAAALVRCVFNVAIKDQKLTGLANPAAGVTMNYSDPAEYGRARYLKREELPRVFAALDAYADQNQADLFRLCLLTGARKGNVQTMRWQDLNQETLQWRIPGEAHKNGTPVDVPLIPIALAILNRRHAERKSDVWVFPSRKRNPKTPYMTGARPAWMAICKTANIEGVRIHDLRRTMGSWQALTGASLAVIGQSLGHKDAETTQIYARLNDDVVRSSMTKAAAAMIDAGKVGAA